MTDKTKIPNYFIRKEIADRLKAGESVPAYEITLWGYDDPDAFIACDLLIGETS